MEKLAMLGGSPVIPRGEGRVEWPIITDADEDAVRRVLRSGRLTCISAGGRTEVQALEGDWARYVGTRHCVMVANGTAAIAVALAATGVGSGDEVLVPALSFIGSALAVLHVCAIPVFVDIHPRTFNIDPSRIEDAVTPRTRAIVAVHLHGLPADMDEIHAIARRHDLVVIEDAAQAQGARYNGRRAGALAEIAAFSLNVSKNLPTCGEGGLVTTDSPDLYQRALMLRQFGELIGEEDERRYVHQILGWNLKPNAIQAAFTRSQLARFPEDQAARDRNARRFLDALSELPGLVPPFVPPDRTHAWHILRLRLDPSAAALDGVRPGPFRAAVQRALRAEGVPATMYQHAPLPAQGVFQTREGFGRGFPWRLASDREYHYRADDHPTTLAVLDDSLTIQRTHLNPSSGPLLDRYAEAFHKVWRHLDVAAKMARSMPYEPPWHAMVSAATAGAGR